MNNCEKRLYRRLRYVGTGIYFTVQYPLEVRIIVCINKHLYLGSTPEDSNDEEQVHDEGHGDEEGVEDLRHYHLRRFLTQILVTLSLYKFNIFCILQYVCDVRETIRKNSVPVLYPPTLFNYTK
jgi:hypothetical protein